jgi:hypothetical protein
MTDSIDDMKSAVPAPMERADLIEVAERISFQYGDAALDAEKTEISGTKTSEWLERIQHHLLTAVKISKNKSKLFSRRVGDWTTSSISSNADARLQQH